MRDYFKNGEGINFIFPIDGDCVNEYDGFVKDGVLYVNARIDAPENEEIYINGEKAEYKNGAF